MQRGEIWWADLAEPRGSEPGYRRPVVVVQSDAFNRSRIGTVIVAAVTSNMELARHNIDILGVLQDKTKGNLDDEESKLLETVLYDLRMKFIEKGKA